MLPQKTQRCNITETIRQENKKWGRRASKQAAALVPSWVIIVGCPPWLYAVRAGPCYKAIRGTAPPTLFLTGWEPGSQGPAPPILGLTAASNNLFHDSDKTQECNIPPPPPYATVIKPKNVTWDYTVTWTRFDVLLKPKNATQFNLVVSSQLHMLSSKTQEYNYEGILPAPPSQKVARILPKTQRYNSFREGIFADNLPSCTPQ